MINPSHPSKTHKLKQLSLKWVLIIPFVIQIIGTVSLVGYLSYRSGQEAVENMATQLMENTGQQVTQELKRYLQTAHETNQRHIAALNAGVISLDKLKALHRYLLLQHRQIPSLATLLLGTAQGDFRHSHRIDVEDYGISTPLQPQELPYEANLSDAHNPNVIRSYSVDERSQLLRYLATITNKDVRKRPWYRAAAEKQQSGWSQPFQSGISNRLTLSAYSPFYDTAQHLLGVFSANISLHQLNIFLRHLKVGQHGGAYIMERNGLLIANSSEQASYIAAANSNGGISNQAGAIKFQRISADQLANPAIKESYQYLKARFTDFGTLRSAQTAKFSLNNHSYFYNITDYKDAYGLDWLIVTVIPEADFMAEIDANTRLTIQLCLLTLFIAIVLTIITSSLITRPIRRLSEASIAIAQGELNQLVKVQGVAELKILASSFNQMAHQLNDAFENLEHKIEQRTRKLNKALQDLVSVNSKLEQQIIFVEQQSVTDELTQLYNRRYFNELFPKEINRAVREHSPISFLIFDVDHFKQYNDNYGHHKGDDVLRTIGQVLKNQCQRVSDAPFRLGGEEFGIIFTHLTNEEALNFANKIRLALEDMQIEHLFSSAASHVTASFGLVTATVATLELDMDDFYKQADSVLYEAKEQGRNRVRASNL